MAVNQAQTEQTGEANRKDDTIGLVLPNTNDWFILKAIGEEYESDIFAFQGIKRRLGLHQETLSRALHRLERDGFVERVGKSYKLSDKAHASISGRAVEDYSSPIQDMYSVPIVRTIIPQDVHPSDLVSALRSKWFGNLRWYGWREGDGYATMTWVTEEGKLKLTARIAEGSIIIDAFPATKDNMTRAINSAYQLFDHVMKAIRILRGSPGHAA